MKYINVFIVSGLIYTAIHFFTGDRSSSNMCIPEVREQSELSHVIREAPASPGPINRITKSVERVTDRIINSTDQGIENVKEIIKPSRNKIGVGYMWSPTGQGFLVDREMFGLFGVKLRFGAGYLQERRVGGSPHVFIGLSF